MKGEVSIELPISASAEEVWATISSRNTPKLVHRLLSDSLQKVDIIKGDGGVCSVLHIVLSPESPEPREWIEEFVAIDHEKRIKKIRMIEGGFLDLGFKFHETVFEIIEKDRCSCIYKSSIVFEADDNEKFAASASLITAAAPWMIPYAIQKHITQNKAT